eukprot:COSAG03_NODE_936_length_5265_cov_20.249322_8_plen_84_part_01
MFVLSSKAFPMVLSHDHKRGSSRTICCALGLSLMSCSSVMDGADDPPVPERGNMRERKREGGGGGGGGGGGPGGRRGGVGPPPP